MQSENVLPQSLKAGSYAGMTAEYEKRQERDY